MKKLLALVFVLLSACAPADVTDAPYDDEVESTSQAVALPTWVFTRTTGITSITTKAAYYNTDVTATNSGSTSIVAKAQYYSVPVSECANPNSPYYYQYKVTPDTANNVSWQWYTSALPPGIPASSLNVWLCSKVEPVTSSGFYSSPGGLKVGMTPGLNCLLVTGQNTGSTNYFNNTLFHKGIGHLRFYLLMNITNQGTGSVQPAVVPNNLQVSVNVTRYGAGGCN